MKLRVVIDVEVSKTMAETIKRSGFKLCNDGSAMQVKVENSPAIPKRKTKVKVIDDYLMHRDDIC
tara:strand:+ start:1495 stop:1689 length:195 start_codon:yes stop_codon:yes gene_type:complete